MSSIEARVAKLEKVIGPEESDKPCVRVEITRGASHLLTAGDAASTEKPRKRRAAGHKCGDHCIAVSINFNPPVSEGTRGDSASSPESSDDAVGTPSGESRRGDVQRLPESAAAGGDVEPQSGPPRSPAPVSGPGEGPGDVLIGGRARDAVVEVERTDRPAVAYPIGALELERRQEAAAVARALSQDLQSITPWWLPVARVHLGLCAVPYCGHPAEEHRGIRTRLPCGYCGFQADQHDPDGIALEVPYASRRATPCSLYRAIYVDEVDSDKCEVLGCGCRGWRRVPPDPRSELSMLKARLEEKDRIIASNEQKLARLREEMAAAERELLRATSKPNDLGASPHGAPVFVEGESA